MLDWGGRGLLLQYVITFWEGMLKFCLWRLTSSPVLDYTADAFVALTCLYSAAVCV
jgi:hypothetical protein